MPQVRDRCGVPQVHVDPQEGGTRGARLAVPGGLPALDVPLQRLLFRAPAQAPVPLRSGARCRLGAQRAPVGACWRGAGYCVAPPAEVAGLREVGGWGPVVEAAEPGIVQPFAKGAPEFQQVGADTAPVVPTERFLSQSLPCVVGEYPMV